MKTVCESDMCTGCTACCSTCAKSAIVIEKTLSSYNAIIDENKCVDCGMCQKVCPQNNPVQLFDPIIWKQGWALDDSIRDRAASGGAVTSIMYAFVKNGGTVCSCTFYNGRNTFFITSLLEKVGLFSGSKYVKSDLTGMLYEIQTLLRKNEKVLFVGLPCQVAGLKNYLPLSLLKNLYTIDLICHGTPSEELFSRYLREHGVKLNDINQISFRRKSSSNHLTTSLAPRGIEDSYTIAFLKCLSLTSNCYKCQYAGTKRVSDLTLGDSWGSDLKIEEKDRGVSLAIVISKKGLQLLEMAELHLEDVDSKKAIDNNSQLRKPAKNDKRESFFEQLEHGKSFDSALFRIYPQICIKQDIKKILFKIGVLKSVPKIQYGISFTILKKR